jgi:hypothetical protein
MAALDGDRCRSSPHETGARETGRRSLSPARHCGPCPGVRSVRGPYDRLSHPAPASAPSHNRCAGPRGPAARRSFGPLGQAYLVFRLVAGRQARDDEPTCAGVAELLAAVVWSKSVRARSPLSRSRDKASGRAQRRCTARPGNASRHDRCNARSESWVAALKLVVLTGVSRGTRGALAFIRERHAAATASAGASPRRRSGAHHRPCRPRSRR